ncbi:unnamed protein product [Victoria cruziana]
MKIPTPKSLDEILARDHCATSEESTMPEEGRTASEAIAEEGRYAVGGCCSGGLRRWRPPNRGGHCRGALHRRRLLQRRSLHRRRLPCLSLALALILPLHLTLTIDLAIVPATPLVEI